MSDCLWRRLLPARHWVIGFDIDHEKIDLIEQGQSYIKHISNAVIETMRSGGLFQVTTDFLKFPMWTSLSFVCRHPCPSTENQLGPVLGTGQSIMPHLQKGQLVVMESSTYPGTTDTELAAVLEQSGLKEDRIFILPIHASASLSMRPIPPPPYRKLSVLIRHRRAKWWPLSMG